MSWANTFWGRVEATQSKSEKFFFAFAFSVLPRMERDNFLGWSFFFRRFKGWEAIMEMSEANVENQCENNLWKASFSVKLSLNGNQVMPALVNEVLSSIEWASWSKA